LDVAQENRAPSDEERDLRARLKRRIIGLVVLERTRKRQASRVANLKERDANMRYFHLCVNARRWKNHILHLKHNNGWVTEHHQKKKIIHSHFTKIIKRGPSCNQNLNCAIVPTPTCDLTDLGAPFLEEEVKAAVDNTPVVT
jgi:hypothetical protein